MNAMLRKGFYALDMLFVCMYAIIIYHYSYLWNVGSLLLVVYPLWLRANLTLLLYHREKRAIRPIGLFMLLFLLSAVAGYWDRFVYGASSVLTIVVSDILNWDEKTFLTLCEERGWLLALLWILWLWLIPVFVYVTQYLRKNVVSHDYTRKELLGLALVDDRTGRFFLKLAAWVFIAMQAGCVTNERITFWTLLIVPLVVYRQINLYVGRRAEWTEYVFLLFSMWVFNRAQFYCNEGRIARLAISHATVLGVTVWMYAKSRRLTTTVGTFLMVSFVLPNVALGYNVYTSLDGHRNRNYADYTIRKGVFFTVNEKDDNHWLWGLRDRYGVIIPCEFDTLELTDWRHHKITCKKQGKTYVYNVFGQLMKSDSWPEMKFDETSLPPEGDVWWTDTANVLSGYRRYAREFADVVGLCGNTYGFLVDYPTAVVPNHQRIDTWLKTRVGRPKGKNWAEIASSKADWFLAEAHSELQDLGEDGYHYSFSDKTSMRARISNERFVSYQIFHSEYTGGLHEQYSENLVSFDPVHDVEIDWNYLFSPDKKVEIAEELFKVVAADSVFRYWEKPESMEDIRTCFLNILGHEGEYYLPQPGLREDGMVFSYQPYGISCFAAGVFHFVVPYEKLMPYMTERAKWCVQRIP